MSGCCCGADVVAASVLTMGLKSKKFTKQSYKKCLQESIDTGVPFVDQEFKACDSSLFSDRRFLTESDISRVLWKRPLQLVRDPHLLFGEKIGPNVEVEVPVGIGQNRVLLTAGAAVARDKSLIYRLVPKDQFNFLHGIFKIYLWNWGNRVKIVIDDKLPCDDEKLAFSSSRCGSIFWLPLLEKGLAKFYGSYEFFAKNCSLVDAFTLLTGFPSEIVSFESDSEQNMFRLIVEELENGSLLCVRSQPDASSGIIPDSYYLVASAKKPNLGSFKKKITATSAVITIVPTQWQPDELGSTTRRKDVCLKVEQFASCLNSMLICHRKKKFNTVFGMSESQFLFDVSSSPQEVLIEVTQQKLHGLDEICIQIHRVEVNRLCKLTHPADALFSTKAQSQRTVFSRVCLKAGRYILIPKSSRETNVMIRTHNAMLRETSRVAGDRDWTQKVLARPAVFVTRVLILRVSNLQKPDHIRTLNPYCRVSVGKEAVRSHVCRSTSNPDFENFGSIFYLTKLKDLLIEVCSEAVFKDISIASLTVPLQVTADDQKPAFQSFDLKDKSGSVCGSIEMQYETYTDMTRI